MNDDLQQKYDSLMDENRKLKGEQNAKQTSEYNSLVREYCNLQEENKKLKENFTHLMQQLTLLQELALSVFSYGVLLDKQLQDKE